MKVWQFIQEKFSSHINVMLLYVLHSKGSSPGRQGFKMAVAEDGSFSGSIGGGMMEHKFVEMARARLREEQDLPTVYRQVHDKEAGKNKSGMICSGEQTIFLYLVQEKDIQHIVAMISSLQQNKNATLHLSNAGIVFSDEVPSDNFSFIQQDEEHFLLLEKTGYKNTLHVIGGGHCSLALCRLMSTMDFYIHIYDERDVLNTMEQNVYAHEKHIVSSYEELNALVKEEKNSYIVIMTFGYRTDDIALKALCNKDLKYIGLLGSKNKVAKMMEGYVDQHKKKLLGDNIFSPVGLPIKSQTPEEIAVSIAAEIISIKNKDQ